MKNKTIGMRRMVLGCLGLLLALPGRTQTFAEWFKQNSTRLKYYAKQIAALEVYLGQLQKGYQISDVGLGAIVDSKRGEFDLHTGYYASFEEINPALGKLGEVAEIAAMQAAIIQRFTDALARYRRDGLLGADRLAYIGQVYSNLLEAGLADAEVLLDVLTADNWQMTDDQRMSKIREVEAAMRERHSFTLAFTNRTDMLERQLVAERTDMGTVRALYGIP